MSFLEVIVKWTSNKTGIPITFSDVNRINIRRGSSAKHNTCDIILANSFNSSREYVDSGNQIQFTSEDPVSVYVKYADGVPIDTSSTDDLLFSGRVVEFSSTFEAGKSSVKLLLSDSSYLALNKVWVGDESGTSSSLIKNVLIKHVNQGETDSSKIIKTDGGFIATAPSIAASFATTRISKVFKPVYEIIDELSQPRNTGDGASNYRFHIDRNNQFHWFYPSDSALHVINEGDPTLQGATSYVHPVTKTVSSVTDSNIHRVTSSKLKKAVYDTTNFIIFKAGEDMNNVQILDFDFDPTSGSPTTKDSFRSWETIARDMKLSAENESVSSHKIIKSTGDIYSYPTDYTGGFVPVWNDFYGTTVATDSAYNTAFIKEATRIAKGFTSAEFAAIGNPRYKGTIEVKGENNFDSNEPIIFSSDFQGIQNIFMRITGVSHNISKSGWFTTLNVEEELTKELKNT